MRPFLVFSSLALVLGACLYHGELDFAVLDRLKLALAGVTALLVLLRHHGFGRWGQHRTYLRALALTAVVSWAVYFNFGGFHGARTWLHIHDVAHYYLGSKYFQELGYTHLYTAMLRAEAEVFNDRFRALEVRDLENNGLYDIRVLLSRSGAVKARFTPQRWAEFCLDVAYFRGAMGRQYGEILRDHGFNPTPFWALLGGSLAQRVPPGSHEGILLLSALDPLLEIALFALIFWAFGLEIMLLSMLYYTLLFGASFGWTGGAFLRYIWLVCTVGAVCCIHRGREAVAGVLLAVATVLRVFPAAFALPLLIQGRLRFFKFYAATGLLLAASTLLMSDGWSHWMRFRQNMQRHMQNTAYNSIGLTQILAYDGPSEPTDEASYHAALQHKERIHTTQLLIALPLALGWLAWRSRKSDGVAAMALVPALLFVGLDLAAYYGVLLLVLFPALRRHRPLLAFLFAVETLMYLLRLVEEREQVAYLYRNILLAVVLIAVSIPAFRRFSAVRGFRGAPVLRT